MCSKTNRKLFMTALGALLCASGIGAHAASSAGTLQYSSSTDSTAYNAGAVVVTLDRVGGASGAVRVGLNTHPGSALSGLDYTSVNQWVSWADGDAAPKTVSIKILNRGAFSGSRSFSLGLSGESGAALGSPATAEVSISGTSLGGGGPSAGNLELAAASYSAVQTARSVSLGVARTAGSSGTASVKYATSNGSAVSGTDYSSTSGVLTWASGDTALKTVVVPLLSPAAYAGTKSLTLTLSHPTAASLSTPSSAAVNITGTAVVSGGNCTKAADAWVTTGIFDAKQFGDYVVNNNNWGGTPGQKLWANSASCWGVTDTATSDIGAVRSYPSVTRGWTQNGNVLVPLSTPGTNDWTTKSGLGIAVTQLTKAKVHWSFSAPTTTGLRWMGLQDIYFHDTPTPAYTAWPPVVDLMIDQSLGDEVVNSTTYYALVALQSHASKVTIGGNEYLIYVDNSGESAYHASGGHTIHLFNLPTAFSSDNGNTLWGTMNAVNDVAAIVKYLMQSHPLDDAGQPLLNAAGSVISSPLISTNLYLNAINSGWEIDDGTTFTTKSFCVAMQGEPDCP